MYESNAIF